MTPSLCDTTHRFTWLFYCVTRRTLLRDSVRDMTNSHVAQWRSHVRCHTKKCLYGRYLSFCQRGVSLVEIFLVKRDISFVDMQSCELQCTLRHVRCHTNNDSFTVWHSLRLLVKESCEMSHNEWLHHCVGLPTTPSLCWTPYDSFTVWHFLRDSVRDMINSQRSRKMMYIISVMFIIISVGVPIIAKVCATISRLLQVIGFFCRI